MAAPLSPSAPPGAPPRRVDGSMSLLNDLMSHTLDEGYAERAARRGTTPPSRRGVSGLLTLLLLGVVTGIAVDQVRERQQAASGLRGDLEERITAQTADTDALAAEAEALRADLERTRQEALSTDQAGRTAGERVQALALAAATVPVTGEGFVVTVDDPPVEEDADPDELVEGRITDRDLQDVVNALWASGAEAVAVDGLRLTALTAIRSAGEAVLVDFRPVTPPYVVEAVGRPADLELGLVDSPIGRKLQTWTGLFGTGFETERADELRLQGGGEPELRLAVPVEGPAS